MGAQLQTASENGPGSTADSPRPLLIAEGVRKTYVFRRTLMDRVRRSETNLLAAVDDVSFTLTSGETLGIAGESGSGKTTIVRCLIRLVEPDSGSITFDGIDVRAASGSALRDIRRRMQMVFQDPHASLNPRLKVGACIIE